MHKYNLSMGVDWSEIVCLMEVSAMLYKYTYSIYTLYSRIQHSQVIVLYIANLIDSHSNNSPISLLEINYQISHIDGKIHAQGKICV